MLQYLVNYLALKLVAFYLLFLRTLMNQRAYDVVDGFQDGGHNQYCVLTDLFLPHSACSLR